MSRKINMETMRLIALFEKITRTGVKDCFIYKDRLTFLVGEGQLMRALGKNKAHLLRLEKLLDRKVKIVSFHSDKLQFIINLLFPLKVVNIVEEDGIVIIHGPDSKTKGLMIGARAQNLRATEEVVRKYFDCKEIKVV